MAKKNSRRRDKKKSKSNKFFSAFFKVFLIVLLFISVAGFGLLSGTFLGYIDNAQDFDPDNLNLDFTTFVYYMNSDSNEPIELERLYGEENRIWANINTFPEHLCDAFIAIEDERFKKHFGVDIKRTLGATFNYLIKGKSSYGGSTITQQLVKNITGDEGVNTGRKIREMFRAISVERKFTKKQILELYLNTIYLANGCNGVQSAANTYFNKDISQLTLAESASIAGITQYPTLYDPFINPENNKKKQETVLKKMLELSLINKEEYNEALNEELVFKKGNSAQKVSKQSYFVDQIINDVLFDLQKEKGYSNAIATKLLYSGGLKIYSTLDINVQNSIDKVFKNENNFPNIKGSVQPEASMVVIDPYTGEVKGIVGGRGEKTAVRTLNRATQTKRQPGSTMKPIGAYAPAIEYGVINLASVFDDAALTISNWSPKNYYSGFRGLTTVRDALASSINVVAVKVAQKTGVNNSFNFAKTNLGLSSLVESEKRADGKVYSDKNLSSLSLGGLTDGVSVIEMAAAYVPFVNRGIYTQPYTYTKVLDHNDKILLDKKKDTHVAMSEQTAFLVSDMLKGAVMRQGTGTPARLPNGMTSAGKTGTTDDDKDRWFIGYTPYYVAATWFGYDIPQTVRVSGTNPAIVLWKAVMQDIHKNLKNKDFPVPPNIIQTSICIDSGNKPSELCSHDQRGSRIRTEYFKKGTAPTSICQVHVSEQIDTISGLLATKHCPLDSLENRIFISRAAVSDTRGTVGSTFDSQYDIRMQTYCDIHDFEDDDDNHDGENQNDDENSDKDNPSKSSDLLKQGTNTENKDKDKDKDKKLPITNDNNNNTDSNDKNITSKTNSNSNEVE